MERGGRRPACRRPPGATRRCWFDAGGDATRAAAALQIHRNTFRYRLQRIETLCAVDLDDPAQRFTIELQTRLLTSPSGRS
ncbi:helix-turn-helix domain-containing protein [Amycolatopsis jiangsuensis]|uniref:helix-turn-helix domain-containing protein n=1 Tax=Amycolatopsis jiangsuensis TaxID=1181879 RepID=UPI001617C52A